MSNDIQEIMSGKNINFLIGSGASMPYLATLSVGDNFPTFEQIITSECISEVNRKILYIYYFENWISKMAIDKNDYLKSESVGDNYYSFINFLCNYLDREGNERPKRINIFTTNYDLFFERTFDSMKDNNTISFYNDGSRGFIDRFLSISNYHLNVSHSGVNDFFKREIPTINLFKLHGSVSWVRDDNRIKVDYSNQVMKKIAKSIKKRIPGIQDNIKVAIAKIIEMKIANEFDILTELNTQINDIMISNTYDIKDVDSVFYEYQELPIINPNKWKFNRTVFEQHYYQLLRELNYELERQDSMLIVFGFSFQDEHILEIVKRSLVNPKLQVIIICYDSDTKLKLMSLFSGFPFIKFIPQENEIGDFTFLNKWLGGKTNV